MELRSVKHSELLIYVTYSGIILLPVFIVEPGLISYWLQVSPKEGIDRRIPVVIGMEAKSPTWYIDRYD